MKLLILSKIIIISFICLLLNSLSFANNKHKPTSAKNLECQIETNKKNRRSKLMTKTEKTQCKKLHSKNSGKKTDKTHTHKNGVIHYAH